MIKKTILILSIIVVLLFIVSLILNNNKKIDVDEDDLEVCPAVCVEMWIIINNTCVYDECGSGCGPNNITTFLTQEECLSKI